jgi:hypothetical protein
MNSLPSTPEPVRLTLRHIHLGSYVKWYTLAFAILGTFAAILCTVWYTLDGQLKGGAIVRYLVVTGLFYTMPGLFGSIIFAVIYNSLAGRLGGGLQFDIVVHANSIPPSPPERLEGRLPKINIPETPGRA